MTEEGKRRIHIVGAGLAGLSAALHLATSGEAVTLYEAAPFAGGRCRSFHDRELGCRIDNGNHLVLSGNVAVREYLEQIGSWDSMAGAAEAQFPFMDVKTGERWIVRVNKGRLPLWLFDRHRRIPGTKLEDYASMFRVLLASPDAKLATLLDPSATLTQRFWEPLTIAALNTEMENASARLLASVIVQSFAAGGESCIPLIPKVGLSETFVQPCLDLLKKQGIALAFGHRLCGIGTTEDDKTLRMLDFSNGVSVEVGPKDWVIFALPAWVTKSILPEISMPTEFRAIVSAHYRVEGLVADQVSMTGIIGGLAEWLFVRGSIASATLSCAERYGNYPVRDMAYYIWKDLAKVLNRDPEKLPPHRIFKERCATFAATPEQDALRPGPYTGWKNLVLAGEWTATGLPSTLEGALRSGMKAAQLIMRWE
ncbi:MAG: hydroxysqualene dehydroxylase HpnE [Bdellovibrionales bacterium]